MEVQEQVVLGGNLSTLGVERHHPLVVTVHEINLETLDAHL